MYGSGSSHSFPTKTNVCPDWSGRRPPAYSPPTPSTVAPRTGPSWNGAPERRFVYLASATTTTVINKPTFWFMVAWMSATDDASQIPNMRIMPLRTRGMYSITSGWIFKPAVNTEGQNGSTSACICKKWRKWFQKTGFSKLSKSTNVRSIIFLKPVRFGNVVI